MKIWIDFINTPQVSFWAPFIREFKSENNEIILTCRDSGNTIELLKQHGFVFCVIGNKVGKSMMQKLLFFPKRLFNLYSFIRRAEPDIAVSQSSFYQPIVASLLHIPCLYTNDNEHAKGNLFGFLFAKKVILPVALCKEPFTRKWPLRSKVSFYPSVKEAIYLSQQTELLSLVSENRNKIYFRPEPWSAQYYNGPINFFDETLLSLANKYKIIILPRDMSQTDHYNQAKFKSILVADKPLKIKDIVSDCLLFIGAGGSMTRELAVLGVPVISIYQAKLLCVDNYLVDKGQMIIKSDITYDEIESIIQKGNSIKKDLFVLNDGKESYNKIKNIIINLNQ
jgi:uncharacterized protein